MDIRPPKKNKLSQPQVAEPRPAQTVDASSILRARSRRKTVALVGAAIIIAAASVSTALWYQWALGAPGAEPRQVRVVVEPGDTAMRIAKTLHDHELIRSRLAFHVYTQLTGTRSKLQAGGYVLSPNQDVSSIVEHMVSGETDELDITIPPGLTLDGLRKSFFEDGFGDQEITEAFDAVYSHPLLSSRPSDASLEGYIYPETYRVNADEPLRTLLSRSFDEFYTSLQEKKYLEAYQARGLTIHQAVTLASMVQQEVENPTDQKRVAQVFLKRLKSGIALGSDVTFLYAAEQLGVRATPGLDSPYNTRKYKGLPPGPISNMNPSALEAVAYPAAGDFLFFVAGDGPDEGKTFFSRTEAEHQANIKAHCRSLCR